ncbi:Macrolide export protein MacA [Vibrio ruber DSM 16370]|uniref:Macrolide export protein MacA n=1 Tax=Vibrio ruber (strain DSM 16370 / JCM 11486 / BCRC 17186 / CECT 7878 / LMG 23124 / VR1) TaxID=1123498 RepID=A0A1R4L9A7_VIBR1|nr:efflux RND transporter periplasmic adaptor subunit [Vibrio ruber]SJN52977.1 Macrolide export protein MacA [Vibrio ruber DSM 16370]
MKKLSKQWLLFAILLFLVLSVGITYWWLQPEPQPVYATQTVKRGHIENNVLANGILQASKLVSVGAQVSGQIVNLPVKLGEQVKKGQLIAQIDSLTQQNSLKESLASLASLKAQYRAKQAQIRQARLAYARQKAMLADNASSKADYELAESNLAVYQAELDQLSAGIEQAEINVDSAKVDLGYTKISAPMDGTVVYTAVEVGQTVNANQTTPTIVELANLNQMTVKAEISEADVIHVHSGQPVYFTILGQPNHRYHATLRAIEPGPTVMDGDDSDMTSNDSEAIYYNGLFDIDNPDGVLRIGMTAQVTIVLNQSDDALIIPAQILRPRDNDPNGYQVPVLVKGQVEFRDVTIGINNKVRAEVLSGLNEGDKVILSLPSGDSYTPRRFRRSMGM